MWRMPVGLWRAPEVGVLRPQGRGGGVPPAALAPARTRRGGVPHGGAGCCPYPQRQGRGARHIFLCAPTRDVTHASLPHHCATGTITLEQASFQQALTKIAEDFSRA